jgi:hypothetical protein
MSLPIEIKWSYTGPDEENLDFSRVLYAYLHPGTKGILYIGKADRCSVYERLRGPHKEAIFSDISSDLRLSAIHAIVGLLFLPAKRRFSSELLTDVESLLIMELQPPYNTQSRQSRILRPGLAVRCSGEWPLRVARFKDV